MLLLICHARLIDNESSNNGGWFELLHNFDNSKSRKLPVTKTKRIDKDNLYKPFKVHDYEQLLILSGLYTEFSNKINTDLVFGADWSVISKWDESLRYSTGTNKADVESFLKSIKNMILWLQQYL